MASKCPRCGISIGQVSGSCPACGSVLSRSVGSRSRHTARSKKGIGKVIVALAILLVIIVIIAAVAATASRSKAGNTAGNGSTDQAQDQNGSHNETSASSTDPVAGTTTNATVYFIDVGQGDSELIQTSDGRNVLIDAGPSSAGSTLVSFLRSHNATTIDALIITHPDADHIGGGDEVLAACTVQAVYQSGYMTDSRTYAAFEAAVVAEGCPAYNDTQLNPGDHLDINSSVTFEIMAIDAWSETSNDASLVIKMTDGTVDILFMGDASSSVESQMDGAFGTAVDVEILKVGHHGSSSSTSASFLSQTTPTVAVIEVGAGNSYGHPTNEALERLDAAGSLVYRTDLNGTVTITTDGTTWQVTTDRQ